jgi:hypothetical protein
VTRGLVALLLEGKYFGMNSSFAELLMGEKGKIIQVKKKIHTSFYVC